MSSEFCVWPGVTNAKRHGNTKPIQSRTEPSRPPKSKGHTNSRKSDYEKIQNFVMFPKCFGTCLMPDRSWNTWSLNIGLEATKHSIFHFSRMATTNIKTNLFRKHKKVCSTNPHRRADHQQPISPIRSPNLQDLMVVNPYNPNVLQLFVWRRS